MSAAAQPARQPARVFRGSVALAQGNLTRRQLRGPRWRRLLRDVYADARLPVTHGLYIAAARLLIPPQAVIAGRSAGWLYGAGDLVAAVTALDLVLARGVLSAARLEQAAAQLPRTRGCACARRAAQLADERSESPQESRMRVGLVLRRVTGFVPQYVVRRDGRFIARVDLGDAEAKLALEYDGLWHGDSAQLGRDRRRLIALAAAGWRVVHATAADIHHLDEFAATVSIARQDQLGLNVGRSGRSTTTSPG